MTLSDFGGFPPGEPAETHRPDSLEALCAVMAGCAAKRRPVRTRGNGHSMNGMAVPCANEALVDLGRLRHLSWRGDGRLAAGAGVSVWELDRHVREFGWKLGVVNDGQAEAPTIGGFVAAGGFGADALFHGGFWNTVCELTVVDGVGQTRRLTPEDPAFRWQFGALGGLGVVCEAVLELVALDDPRPVQSVDDLPRGEPAAWPPHLWLTIFAPPQRSEEASERLQALISAHPGAWRPLEPYEYFLTAHGANPPLLLPGEGDYVALGAWGDRGEDDEGLARYLALEEAFQAVIQEAGLRRYFQSELIRSRRPLAAYVGPACAAAYAAMQAQLDPLGLLNRFMPAR